MSHFLTVVLLPPNTKDIEKGVKQALAPFDENIKMAKYETDCHCIGGIAQREAREAADKKCGDINGIRDKFWAEHERIPWLTKKDLKDLSKEDKDAKIKAHQEKEDAQQKEWEKVLDPWEKAKKEALESNPKQKDVDP